MYQMQLAEILVNPSVEPEDELRLSRQALKERFGLTVKIVKKAKGGVNYYQIANLED